MCYDLRAMWWRIFEGAVLFYVWGTLISIVIGVLFGLWLYFFYL